MTAIKSSKNRKPAKPYKDFPLFAHNNGQWAKKIKGRIYCFGVWADWNAALEKYEAERDRLQTGREIVDKLSLGDGINRYLTMLEQERDLGEISPRHFDDVVKSLRRIVGYCDPTSEKRVYETVLPKSLTIDSLGPDDFQRVRRMFAMKKDGKTPVSPNTLGPHITRTKTFFNYLFDEGLIERPVNFGSKFKPPAKRKKRLAREQKAAMLFEREEILEAIAQANYRLKAMILLGVNCGLGNEDISRLKFSDFNLLDGWLYTLRNKTGVRRRAKLWATTVDALQMVIDRRFEPASDVDANLVFITRHRRAYNEDPTTVTQNFTKLLKKIDAYRGDGRSFYSLKKTFRTIADGELDFVAVKLAIGHADNSIDDYYRLKIDDARLERIAERVRVWLYGEEGGDQ